MRIAFMGTPDFAAHALQALAQSEHEIAAVYTQPPRPRGRGQTLTPSPVQALADKLGLPVRTPVSMRDPAEAEFLKALNVDVAAVVAYGQILPQAVLDAPRLGCFNLHGSLLPRWRGAAPINRAIMAGDAESGVMVMKMDVGLDTGDVAMAERLPITDTMTAADWPVRRPARPARCQVEAMVPGYPAITQTSRAPMSMPSSSALVETTPRTSPARRPFSISRRRSGR